MRPALGGPNDEQRTKGTLARSSCRHACGVGHRPHDSVVHCDQAGTVCSASTIVRLLLKRPNFTFKISWVWIIQTEPLPPARVRIGSRSILTTRCRPTDIVWISTFPGPTPSLNSFAS